MPYSSEVQASAKVSTPVPLHPTWTCQGRRLDAKCPVTVTLNQVTNSPREWLNGLATQYVYPSTWRARLDGGPWFCLTSVVALNEKLREALEKIVGKSPEIVPVAEPTEEVNGGGNVRMNTEVAMTTMPLTAITNGTSHLRFSDGGAVPDDGVGGRLAGCIPPPEMKMDPGGLKLAFSMETEDGQEPRPLNRGTS